MAICLNALHPIGMQFAEKITMMLERKGWTQRELARRAKVSHTTVGNWINDDRLPDIEVGRRLAKVLDVPLEYLADPGQDEPVDSIAADELSLLKFMRKRGISTDAVLDLIAPTEDVDGLNPKPKDAKPKHRRA